MPSNPEKSKIRAAERSLKRGLAQRKSPQSEATTADAALSRDLRKVGISSSPSEVAFARIWDEAGWAPTRVDAESLVAVISIDHIETRIDGDDRSGYTIYRKR